MTMMTNGSIGGDNHIGSSDVAAGLAILWVAKSLWMGTYKMVLLYFLGNLDQISVLFRIPDSSEDFFCLVYLALVIDSIFSALSHSNASIMIFCFVRCFAY